MRLASTTLRPTQIKVRSTRRKMSESRCSLRLTYYRPWEHLSRFPEKIVSESVPTEAELIALLESDERSMSVVITNPAHPDNPMIYVSEEFETQTGYSPDEALGRNCRFLQGPDTDPAAVERIRQGLARRETFSVDILNYRKSGAPFLNRLRIRPLFDGEGEFIYFAGVQNPI